jgi:hypothetical protein
MAPPPLQQRAVPRKGFELAQRSTLIQRSKPAFAPPNAPLTLSCCGSKAFRSNSLPSSCSRRAPLPQTRRRRVSAPPYMRTEVPLLSPRRLSYKRLCEQAAAAVVAAAGADPDGGGARLLTVDFPPERTEQRAGTLVRRFENNLNMCEKLLEELGVARGEWTSVGTGVVEIRDNVNPQGGGDYLTDDECMIGVRALSPRLGGRPVMMLINAGVDKATLRQVKDLDEGGRDVIVLVNCNLSSLSFFDKLGGLGTYIDQFKTAYYLKLFLGVGMLLKNEPEPWAAFAQRDDGAVLIEEFAERPEIYRVEQLLRQNVG